MTAALLAAACLTASACDAGTRRAGAEQPAGPAPATTASGTHSHTPGASPPPAVPLRAGERFVTLTLPRPYAPQAPSGGTDEYRCFLVDPQLPADAFLTGSQFLPQNADLVHHAIFFRLGRDDAERARRLDDASQGDGWTCFGDSGFTGAGANWVAAWAPGANETLLNPGLGFSLPAGSRLVMQIHYNLLATGGKPGGTDQSGIRLRLTDASAGIRPLETLRVAAPVELACAAGESGPLCDRAAAVTDVARRFGDDAGRIVTALNRFCNAGRPPVASPTQHCDRPVGRTGTVYAVAGHMHLLGRAIRVELNPGTARATTLLDVPVYNFDDQSSRPLATPVPVKAGDVLRVTCTHDAGLRRQLPQLRTLPPRYVVWGDGTSDEMCLGLVILGP